MLIIGTDYKISLTTLTLMLTSFFAIKSQEPIVKYTNAQPKNIKLNKEAKSKKQISFAIIKPDAIANKYSGEIIRIIELNNFDIIGMKKISLTKKQAQDFYCEHKDKPFFKDLVQYMTSGPIIVLALEKHNAIKDWRDLMGSTNPEQSSIGTLRKMFGESLTKNAVHGSDSEKSAQRELKFFF